MEQDQLVMLETCNKYGANNVSEAPSYHENEIRLADRKKTDDNFTEKLQTVSIDKDDSNLTTSFKSDHIFEANEMESKNGMSDYLSCTSRADEKTSQASHQLSKWAVTHNIPQSATDELLLILRNCGHSNLPKRAKSLLKSPRSNVNLSLK